MKKVNNPIEIWEELSGETCSLKLAKEKIEKAVYKGTDCGAWISFKTDYVMVGSIVEGVDEGTDAITLKYPFKYDQLWEALDQIEKQADEIWKRTHGCEDCGEEDPETGYIAINPDCKTCQGEGTVI